MENLKKEEKKKPGKETKKKERKNKVDYYESKAELIRPNKNKPILVENSKNNILITSSFRKYYWMCFIC